MQAGAKEKACLRQSSPARRRPYQSCTDLLDCSERQVGRCTNTAIRQNDQLPATACISKVVAWSSLERRDSRCPSNGHLVLFAWSKYKLLHPALIWASKGICLSKAQPGLFKLSWTTTSADEHMKDINRCNFTSIGTVGTAMLPRLILHQDLSCV